MSKKLTLKSLQDNYNARNLFEVIKGCKALLKKETNNLECEILLAGGGPTVRLYCVLDGYSGSSQHRVDHSHACAIESLDLRRTMWPASFSILEDALELYILNVARYVQEY